jgi:choline dehydrogenase-like flavoprotein
MSSERYDVIIVGSGTGGAAAAYRLARAGRRVLMLEKGRHLPKDASTTCSTPRPDPSTGPKGLSGS